MQNNPRTHGLWAQSAPPAPQTAALEGAERADVVVIGGGYTGLSSALHLAERGVDVVLLEAAEIGFGGAGRNVGLVNAGMWVMPEVLVQTLGQVHGERLLSTLGEGPAEVWDIVRRHDIACEATPNGTLHAAVGRKGQAEIAERARQWQARGARVELLDRADAAALLGTDHFAGALLDHRTGTIQPLAYARGLARAAQGKGARIHTQSPALRLAPAGSGWRVETPGGTVQARQVVFGTDAYTAHLMPQIRDQQVFLPYFNVATPPLPEDVARTILPGRHGAWDTKEVLLSFRMDAANRLVFGSVGALRGTGIGVHRAWAQRMIARLFPQIGRTGFEHEWYGQIGMTTDNLPRFHVLAEGVYTFCGYNGRGIAPGTVFGRVMADFLTGNRNTDSLPLPVTTPTARATRGLQSLGYEIGAQLVHLTEGRL